MTMDFHVAFGKHIQSLRDKSTLDEFIDELRKVRGVSDKDCGYKRNRQFLNHIEAGERQTIPTEFILDVAKAFQQDANWLMCLAGQPPAQVIEKLVRQPEKYLHPLLAEKVSIGVPKILQAAHIISAVRQQGTIDFGVTLYDKGRDALTDLVNDKIKYCVTTTSARQFLMETQPPQGQKIIELVELKAPQQTGIYYRYATDVQESSRRLAYLDYSIGTDLAKGYQKHMKEPATFVQANSLTDVVEKIYHKEISGFIGWPPQDLEVMHLLTRRLKVSSVPQEFRLKSQDLDEVMKQENLERNLVLMTTDRIVNQRPAVLVELISILIEAAAEWVKNDRRPEVIKDTLCSVTQLHYLSGSWWRPERDSREELYKQNCFNELKAHLARLTFNITIREEAFPYLTDRQVRGKTVPASSP